MNNRRVDIVKDVEVVHTHQSRDMRGTFRNLFRRSVTGSPMDAFEVRQVNHSVTKGYGTVRGMHLQVGDGSERKIVHCVGGEIFDLVVDLRSNSTTYGCWFGKILSPENSLGLLIPRGCAHGFQSLSEECEVIYLHDNDYDPSLDSGVNALDETLNIAWPLPVINLSERDQALMSLPKFFQQFEEDYGV